MIDWNGLYKYSMEFSGKNIKNNKINLIKIIKSKDGTKKSQFKAMDDETK